MFRIALHIFYMGINKNINIDTVTNLINKIKKLPRFEGSHCPSQSDHEYIKRVDTGRYVRLEDVLKVIANNLENKDEYGYYKNEEKSYDPSRNYEF